MITPEPSPPEWENVPSDVSLRRYRKGIPVVRVIDSSVAHRLERSAVSRHCLGCGTVQLVGMTIPPIPEAFHAPRDIALTRRFSWIPAYAGMTVIKLDVADRHSRASWPRRRTAPLSREEYRESTCVRVVCSRHSLDSRESTPNNESGGFPWKRESARDRVVRASSTGSTRVKQLCLLSPRPLQRGINAFENARRAAATLVPD